MIKQQDDDDDYSIIDKIHLYVKDPNQSKYQYRMKERKNNSLKNLDESKAFIEYSNNMQDFYKSIEEYNPSRKCNLLIVFDDMIADIISNKTLSPIVTEIFIRV